MTTNNLNIVGVLEVGRYPGLWDASGILAWGEESDTNNPYLLAMVAVLGSIVPVAAYREAVYLPVVDCPEPVTLHARARRKEAAQ